MGRKRQPFSKNFKARVVLEALREESTIQEIAVKHGVHPNLVSQWKSQVIAGMEEIFERPNKKSQEVRQQEEKESEYLKTIGKQKVEIEFLKKVQAIVRRGTTAVDNIEATDKFLSISSQYCLLGISRSQYYYQPSLDRQEKDFKLLVEIKKVQAEHPYYGYRRIWREMDRRGHHTSETAVRRVMRRFGIAAIFPGRNLSKASKYHKKYPYLLRDKVIRHPNQMWSTDITYLRMPAGNVYLMAIIDWYSARGCSIPWMRHSVQIFCGKQSRSMGVRPYPTRIKGASLPPMCFSKCLLITLFKSAWTEQAGHWTISELSVCGEASNMRTST